MKWLTLLHCFFLVIGCNVEKHEKNHLQKNDSSYLRQSLDDKIWWYHWGTPALTYARDKDQLIFLSIGYSSCFACEKMQKTVYIDNEVQEVLNESFVSIKVDREDRPDLDAYFLNMQSLIMGFGAWPINMILTPDLKPVFATTLMDKNSFKKILQTSAETWKNSRSKILQGTTRYEVRAAVQPNTISYYEKDKSLINDFYARYTHRFDPIYGGKSTGRNFNIKFPVNNEMRLLLRYYLHSQNKQPQQSQQALKMVNKTMAIMAKSALFDHIAGGVHRYSTSRDWNSPNYEKMLYDQASFVNSLHAIYKIKKNELYRISLEKMIGFLFNEMASPLGGFYSSFSASLNGVEGSFYTWKPSEMQKALTDEEWKQFSQFYAFTAPQKKYNMKRGLVRKTSFNNESLQTIEDKVKEYRKKRGSLSKDKKVITADSAYVLSALSKLYRTWPSADFYQKIKTNLDYITQQHTSLTGQLFRRSLHGQVAEPAVLDDYAYLIDALIEFYQTEFDEQYLQLAYELQQQQNKLFYDSKTKLFRYSTSPLSLLQDQFLFIDQTRPSGMALTFYNLLRLARYFVKIDWETKANELIDAYPDQLRNDPISYSSLLLALDFQISNSKNFIIVGSKQDCSRFAKEGFNDFNPYILFSCVSKTTKIPLHQNKKRLNSQVSFYVCDSHSCMPPTTDYQQSQQMAKPSL